MENRFRIKGCSKNVAVDLKHQYAVEGQYYSNVRRTASVITPADCPEIDQEVNLDITTHAQLNEYENLVNVPIGVICLYLNCPFNNINS